MSDKKLSTDSYKGVRDFYPADMAVQKYIFETWTKTAESFGFERYDASILEPADLYKAKGAENEELVNEQTYTFTDRGGREVTLRPEMTPTVARMIAGKQRELALPLRWYSIPNLFRYERPQKGRLREHWQFNCDIFGGDEITADIELIALAYQTMINFGVNPQKFIIKINHRTFLRELLRKNGSNDIISATRVIDRMDKLPVEEFKELLKEVVPENNVEKFYTELNQADKSLIDSVDTNLSLMRVIDGLRELGIETAFSPSLARGFDYYTGTIFEVFEVDQGGNPTGRAMLGGGRYDNLTMMFSNEPVSGIGFGMGDVTLRDFLEENNLIPERVRSTTATVTVIPETIEQNLPAEKIASEIRQAGISVATDIGSQKTDKKKARASDRGTKFIIVIGETEITSGIITVKNLKTSEEKSGTPSELTDFIKQNTSVN
ncbi:histidine--tRNA ligase [Candidatus Kaiserbacteria bacterium]|nr:histidine--tRNA ligase [Candidatus Kaiserbacteria bacterium]USN91913.1 MAG: histidine--tRNA ligase [Candidatus Nomurabacteria bacterium]